MIVARIAHGFNSERYLRSVQALASTEAERRVRADVASEMRAQQRRERRRAFAHLVVVFLAALLLAAAAFVF